ncbi:MAG: hypothetical protein J6B54_04835 [Clostridia bacterium]|nr:hypothetical protein [Clostridia bacterium]
MQEPLQNRFSFVGFSSYFRAFFPQIVKFPKSSGQFLCILTNRQGTFCEFYEKYTFFAKKSVAKETVMCYNINRGGFDPQTMTGGVELCP